MLGPVPDRAPAVAWVRRLLRQDNNRQCTAICARFVIVTELSFGKGLGMKVTVEADRCVAAGQCVLLAPDVFDQRDEDGVVLLLDEMPESEHHDAVRESAMVCPAAAIRLTDS